MNFLSKVGLGSLALISLGWGSQFDSFYVHQLEARAPDNGKVLYESHCAVCHHTERIGISGIPPLLPDFIGKYSDKKLSDILVKGLPQTLMPVYDFLKEDEVAAIVKYIKSPSVKKIIWGKDKIKDSITISKDPINPLKIENLEDVTPVVERDGNKVWIMEDDKILSKFNVDNVHGGIKYTMDGKNIYVPTRDGWIVRYQLDQGREFGRVRACVNLRNASLSRDGKHIFATCLLPESMVVLDSQTLEPLKFDELDGKVSALYEYYSKDEAVFTFRNKPKIAYVNTKTFEITYKDLKEPIEDFFLDPFEKYMIGTARRGGVISVFDLENEKYVFEHEIEGMPHLFSATYWYRDGKFYFSTPHIKKSYLTVWEMYNWKFERKIDIGGDGFFVKTHPNTPYLWADNQTDELLLISKNDFSIKKMIPRKGKQYIHTEFSGDAKYTYLSIYEQNGDLIVLDTATQEEIVSYPAKVPVGKYNFINKNRQFYPRLFGRDLFKEKCWGCHHEQSEAFGPSFEKIANSRTDEQIIAHIIFPENSYKDLGYKRNLMPSFDKLNEYEIKSLVDYIKSCKTK